VCPPRQRHVRWAFISDRRCASVYGRSAIADKTEGTVKLFTSLTFGRLVNWGFSLFFISPHDGGYTPVWAAASRQVFEERDKYKGKYLVPYGVLEEASEDARREDLAKELWDTTEGILKDFNWL
jgi:hypothetical protein